MGDQWTRYHAESIHSFETWTVYSPAGTSPADGDEVSASGQPATMRMGNSCGDFALVSMVPKANETTGVGAYAFHLLIRSTGDDEWTALTAKSFSKADILNLANAFVGLTVQQAKRLWNSKKLGPEGLRIDETD